MKKLILLILSIVLTGCETTIPKRNIMNETYEGMPVQVHTIDSCEYIVIPMGNGTWGSHKGNCKFCLKRNKQEFKGSKKSN